MSDADIRDLSQQLELALFLDRQLDLAHCTDECGTSENVIEHLAGVQDYQVAMATYLAACQRRPNAPTLRQETRVIQDSRRTRIV